MWIGRIEVCRRCISEVESDCGGTEKHDRLGKCPGCSDSSALQGFNHIEECPDSLLFYVTLPFLQYDKQEYQSLVKSHRWSGQIIST